MKNLKLNNHSNHSNHNIKFKEEFEEAVELLYNKNIDLANTKLHNLNTQAQKESYEVLYNLALSYEAENL